METITIPLQEYHQMQKRIDDLQTMLAFLQNEVFMQQLRLFLQTLAQQTPLTPVNTMQEFLLKGTVMTDSEYEEFVQKRQHFNQWNPSV